MKRKQSNFIPYMVGTIAGVLLLAAFIFCFEYYWSHMPLIKIGK